MKNSQIRNLISQYGQNVKGVLAVLVYDRKKSLLTEELSIIDLNNAQIQTNYQYIEELIKNLREEFGKDKDFLLVEEISDKKLISCSLGINWILITIALKETSDIELKAYSTHIASEIEMLVEETYLEPISLKIPVIIKVFSKVQEANILVRKLSLKIIVLGDYQAGKTSLVKRFIEKDFKNNLNNTIGFSVYKKLLNINDRILMNLAIWDTGGFSSQISPLKEKIFNFADAAIIVIEKSCKDCLKNIKKWHNEIVNSLNQEIPVILAITKIDINVGEPHLDLNEIEDYAKNHQTDYFLASAKTGENVEDLFFEAIYKVINLRIDNDSVGSIEEIDKYKGNYLKPSEINALKDLEHLIIRSLRSQSKFLKERGNKIELDGIPIIYEIDHTSFGIKIEDGHIVGLGLFNCYLNTLPESISSLKFIKRLNLRCNRLIQLPDVIFKLDLLEWLDIALSDLKSIPKTIGN
ncbi:MAG: GTP-binding protein, partial [Promethearchaeota archaeon]